MEPKGHLSLEGEWNRMHWRWRDDHIYEGSEISIASGWRRWYGSVLDEWEDVLLNVGQDCWDKEKHKTDKLMRRVNGH